MVFTPSKLIIIASETCNGTIYNIPFGVKCESWKKMKNKNKEKYELQWYDEDWGWRKIKYLYVILSKLFYLCKKMFFIFEFEIWIASGTPFFWLFRHYFHQVLLSQFLFDFPQKTFCRAFHANHILMNERKWRKWRKWRMRNNSTTQFIRNHLSETEKFYLNNTDFYRFFWIEERRMKIVPIQAQISNPIVQNNAYKHNHQLSPIVFIIYSTWNRNIGSCIQHRTRTLCNHSVYVFFFVFILLRSNISRNS